MLRAALALVLVAPLASLGSAQVTPQPVPDVSITGVVQPAPPISICQQGATHMLECTQVRLLSNAVDLTALEGQLVTLLGKNVSVTCPVVQVSKSMAPSAVLTMCGTPAVGCPVRFNVCPPGMATGTFLVGTQPTFQPLDVTVGTLLLGGNIFNLGTSFAGIDCAELTAPIPPNPNLVGQTFWAQGVRQDVGPVGTPRLTNALCFTVLPPTVFCFQPNC